MKGACIYSFRTLTEINFTCNMLLTSPPMPLKSSCAIDFPQLLELAPFVISTKERSSERDLFQSRHNISSGEAVVKKAKFLSSAQGAIQALRKVCSALGNVFARKKSGDVAGPALKSLRVKLSGSTTTDIRDSSDKDETSDDSIEDNLSSVDKKGTSYSLAAVVRHLGASASSGHYLADVLYEPSATWMRCNDEIVTEISIDKVLSERDNAYLLVYCRQ